MLALALPSFGRIELILDFVFIAWLIWPMICVGRIARRAGFSSDVGARVIWFCVFPFAVWWFAFVAWPDDRSTTGERRGS